MIAKKQEGANGWFFLLHLPPGVCFADVKKREQYFVEATGGAVLLEKNGRQVSLQVLTDELQRFYPFAWDWRPYDKMQLPFPVGYSAAGFIVRDLAAAPNLLTAGHPGAGKSNFLHVLAVSLLLAREIYLVIIDLKKLEFSYLKQQALVVTSLPDAQQLLRAVNIQLDARLDILEKAGAVKVQDYNGDMPYIVLIIDELAELQDEYCQEALNRIVRLGRAAGICVVAATQRPSSTMFAKFGDSKAMFAASVCFHVRDEVNSRMVLDNPAAALIPAIPGRGVYQWEKQLEVQCMFLPTKEARNLLTAAGKRKVILLETPKRIPPR